MCAEEIIEFQCCSSLQLTLLLTMQPSLRSKQFKTTSFGFWDRWKERLRLGKVSAPRTQVVVAFVVKRTAGEKNNSGKGQCTWKKFDAVISAWVHAKPRAKWPCDLD